MLRYAAHRTQKEAEAFCGLCEGRLLLKLKIFVSLEVCEAFIPCLLKSCKDKGHKKHRIKASHISLKSSWFFKRHKKKPYPCKILTRKVVHWFLKRKHVFLLVSFVLRRRDKKQRLIKIFDFKREVCSAMLRIDTGFF